MSDLEATCEVCGQPMPPGEEMFKYHGYSGPCPLPVPVEPVVPPHEHQFPEADVDGTLCCYPCLLCGLPAADALKQSAEDRASFQSDIERDVQVIHELEAERDALQARVDKAVVWLKKRYSEGDVMVGINSVMVALTDSIITAPAGEEPR